MAKGLVSRVQRICKGRSDIFATN